MKNFSSWLIAMFAFMFWGFRLVGTVMFSLGNDFLFAPSNLMAEIILLFVTFICACFIIKRKLWATFIYLIVQFAYFASTFVPHFLSVIDGSLELELYMTTFFEFVGLVLPIAALFDVLLDRNRKAHPKDKKTDWFYKNEQFDRKLDDRADKNNYRTL